MKRKTSLTSFGFNEKVKYRNFDIEVKVADFVKINEERKKFPHFYRLYL